MSATRMDIGFLLTAAAANANKTQHLPPPPIHFNDTNRNAVASSNLINNFEQGGSHSPVGVMGYNADDALHQQILAAAKEKPNNLINEQRQSSISNHLTLPSESRSSFQLAPPPTSSFRLPISSSQTPQQVTPSQTVSTPQPRQSSKNSLQPSTTLRSSVPPLGVHSNGVKKYVCQEPGCGSEFGQKGSLTRHQKSRHEGRRPHACSQCSKRFSEKWTLNVHERNVHEKRKPHACPECSKRFGERWNLRKHVNVVHRNIKPYACPQCGRAFGYKGDMRKHVMELHVQDGRPFQCAVPNCGVKFARLRYLRRHQNLSHRVINSTTPSISPTIDNQNSVFTDSIVGESEGVVDSLRFAKIDGQPTTTTTTRTSSSPSQQQQPPPRQQQLQQQNNYSALETLSLFAVAAARNRDIANRVEAPK